MGLMGKIVIIYKKLQKLVYKFEKFNKILSSPVRNLKHLLK
jgi:hypothetical protein